MKILVLGANGFIGTSVASALTGSHQVLLSSGRGLPSFIQIDLLDKDAIEQALHQYQPEIVVNCSGILANNSTAELNIKFTRNLLESIKNSSNKPKVIISSSASVYGIVRTQDLPVGEQHPLRPVNLYAKAKLSEEEFALKFANENNLSLVVLRIFNPIGLGMDRKFLIPKLLHQIQEIKNGNLDEISVTRLDAIRDYIDVRDVADAFKCVCEKNTKDNIYNVGSGASTSNEYIIKRLLELNEIAKPITLHETESIAEPVYAVQANIKRIHSELGWCPKYKIDQTLEDIVSDKN